jgi:hypothetical protein
MGFPDHADSGTSWDKPLMSQTTMADDQQSKEQTAGAERLDLGGADACGSSRPMHRRRCNGWGQKVMFN